MQRILFSVLLFSAMICLITACQKEELPTPEPEKEELPEGIQLMDIDAQPYGPDLVVTTFTSDLPVVNTPCGPNPMANVSCNGQIGGNQPFRFLSRVKNIGTVAVPAGSFEMAYTLINGGGTATQTVNHGVIPPGGVIGITSSTYSLPCPTSGPPFGIVLREFVATVDYTDVVDEFNENNNDSRIHQMCDDL